MYVARVMCCQLQISARIPTKYGVSECDREISIMRRPWPNRGCLTMKFKIMMQKRMENYENSLVLQSRIETDTLGARATIFGNITT